MSNNDHASDTDGDNDEDLYADDSLHPVIRQVRDSFRSRLTRRLDTRILHARPRSFRYRHPVTGAPENALEIIGTAEDLNRVTGQSVSAG